MTEPLAHPIRRLPLPSRTERLSPRSRLDLSADPDVMRYRAERDKRAERKRPEMDAARTAFYAMLDTEKAKGRGGRPRKPQPAPKSWEIVI